MNIKVIFPRENLKREEVEMNLEQIQYNLRNGYNGTIQLSGYEIDGIFCRASALSIGHMSVPYINENQNIVVPTYFLGKFLPNHKGYDNELVKTEVVIKPEVYNEEFFAVILKRKE